MFKSVGNYRNQKYLRFIQIYVQLKVEHSAFSEKSQHSPSKSGQVTLFTAASVSPFAEGEFVKWSLNPYLTSVIPGAPMHLLMGFSSLTN